MPHVICPRCQRANPSEAVYCHFDGLELRPLVTGGGRGAPPGALPHEFVFSSGRRCRTYDELVQGCHYEWEEAREMLQKGVFNKYMAGIGRLDLLRAAKEAQAHPDTDAGLHAFVAALPVAQLQGPRLELNPRRLVLGAVRPGETRYLHLTVSNSGKGILQGKLTIKEGGNWLRLAEGPQAEQCDLKIAKGQQVVRLQVDAAGLASPRRYGAKLTVITNGGIVEVPVRIDVIAQPFPRPPFQDVGSPREMAERMRNQPKQAVPLLESGEIARWFTANGWTYPVQGPPARGVAAVQQFFEGMGLSKPPVLQLEPPEVHLMCIPPEVAPGEVMIATMAKKWVYAAAESDSPWLRVTTPLVGGPQKAVLGFEVDSTLMEEGRLHDGQLFVTGNAGQQLVLRVLVDVRRPQVPFTRRLLRPFFLWAMLGLLYRLCLAFPADVFARVLAAPAGLSPEPGTFASWLQPPPLDMGYARSFAIATWWIGAVAGGVWVGYRTGKFRDALFGVIAGAVAGLVGSATLACLLPALDVLPRRVWGELARVVPESWLDGSAWLWTPVWIVVAALCWAATGALTGLFLTVPGRLGARLLTHTARPWSWLFELCGLKRAAALFSP